MKIFHFNLAKSFGGGEVQTLNLLRWLNARQIAQVVVVRKKSPFALRVVEEFPAIRQMGLAGVFWHLITLDRANLSKLVLHAHDGRSLHFCSVLKTLFVVPFIATRRVDKGVPARWFSQRSYSHADRMVAISYSILRRLESHLGAETCVRIPDSFSGFDIDAGEVQKIRERFAGRRLIGQIGSLYDIKGHEYTIAAARKLAAGRPDVHFVFLGEGEARTRLESLASGLQNLTFVGFVKGVGSWLEALDLLVHPSLREGLGSILLEAQQAGVPVIASDVGGIPDVVIDGETGLLVPAGDSQALLDAILRLLDDPILRNRVIVGAQRHLTEFSPETVGKAYLDLYLELLHVA